jgi:hypothetical protein
MSPEEIQKLLGGYATDTLSEAERSALFESALEDQELFDALAKEQALRDVLQDPSARQELIAALGPARPPFRWLRKSVVLATAGSLAALVIVAALVLRQTRHAAHPETMVADAIAPQPPVAMPPPSAAPLHAPGPSVAAHQPKRLARLPAVRALPAPQAVASAAPSPPPAVSPARAQAAGALAGTAGGAPQTVEVTGQSFVAPQPAPMPMARAKAATAAAAKRAVDYTLVLKDADGAYSPVPSGTVFYAGDSVRLQVAPTEAGYIYLFQRADASAAWTLVTSQRVERGPRYMLPATGGLQSEVPAQLELLLVLSRVEHVDIDAQTTPTIVIEYR